MIGEEASAGCEGICRIETGCSKFLEEREKSKSWLEQCLKREDSVQRCLLRTRLAGCKSTCTIVVLNQGASEEVVSASRQNW
jgi:hypothetical protein